jgi:hypothetical protein
MTTHNYFTLNCGKDIIKTCNSVAENFSSLYLSGEHLLKYFYIFYNDNNIFKSEAVYLSGNINKSPYLKYTTTLSETILNGETITSVGLGGESGYINKANVNSFIKSGKIVINATIFIDLTTEGKILNVNFLKMLFNEPFIINGAMLTDKEKQLSDFGFSNLALYNCEKTYSTTLNLSFNTEIKKNNALIIIDNKPSYLAENLFSAYGENTLTTATNFCIDINKNIELVEMTYINNELPLYVLQPYGNYIDKGKQISILKKIDKIDEFKASSDGKCFTIKSADKLTAYKYIQDNAEIVMLFGEYISLTDTICYDVSNNGIAIAYTNGIIKLYNFFSEEITEINKNFENIESIKVSNDFSFLSVWGSVNGYYLHINTDVLQSYVMANQLYSFNSGDNTVARFFSGNVVCYFLNNNSFSYMSLSSNLFNTSPLKELYIFSGFIGKKNENSVVFCNLLSGSIMALSGEDIIKIDVSPSCKYVLVKYNNGVYKLYRFNKKMAGFVGFTYKEALPVGDYYFLGDDKLIKISKNCMVYNIIEDKTQVLFKKSGYYSGEFYVKEKLSQTESNSKVILRAAA